jgi:glycerophosphoryl diester phosphodiesterase
VTCRNLIRRVALVALTALACRQGNDSKPASRAETSTAPLQVKRGVLVARALGGIDGESNTNSLEALRCNYRRGLRWFEVDVATTAEGEPVCFHKGDEKRAGFSQPISKMKLADVESNKYEGRFSIPRLSTVLNETDQLGDVTLVLDTESWSEPMRRALSRTLEAGSPRKTRILLQAYRERDLAVVTPLSKEVGAGVLLNLQRSHATDDRVEELVRKAAPLAVVAGVQRFTPWLAERLHTLNTPIQVHTVNAHRDVVNLTRAGADGFYTDSYVPWEEMATNPTAVLGCSETAPSATDLAAWTERDLQDKADFRLSACATRKGSQLELANCGEKDAVRSKAMDVRGGQTLNVELEVEAGNAPTQLWIEVVKKLERRLEAKTLRPRELVSLKAKERRSLKFAQPFPEGSAGVEARLGLAQSTDRLTVHRLKVYQGESVASRNTQPIEEDAGAD